MSKKEAGEKFYSWSEQGEMLEKSKGIPVNELNNTMNGLISVRQDAITDAVSKKIRKVTFEDPNGTFGIELQAESTRRTADGATYEVPEHYEGFSFFRKEYLGVANAGFEVTPRLVSKGGDHHKKSKAA